jgi:hypothetical protein
LQVLFIWRMIHSFCDLALLILKHTSIDYTNGEYWKIVNDMGSHNKT